MILNRNSFKWVFRQRDDAWVQVLILMYVRRAFSLRNIKVIIHVVAEKVISEQFLHIIIHFLRISPEIAALFYYIDDLIDFCYYRDVAFAFRLVF